MKDLEGVQTKEPVEIQAQQEKKQEQVIRDRIHTHPGHTLWEVDPKTLTCVEAKFEKGTVKASATGKVPVGAHAKVIMKNDRVYISALNPANALKKLRKGSNGSSRDPRRGYVQLAVGAKKTKKKTDYGR